MNKALAILALAVLACRVSGPGSTPEPLATPAGPLPTVQPSSSDTDFFVVTVGNWNCRETPGGRVIAYASVGQVVEVLASPMGGWVQVDLAGQKCWLRKAALK
jgi:hypothetical protein